MDYSYQAIFNPCEALLSDIMQTCNSSTQTMGFSIYSACLSLGCIIGYLIVCVKWTSIIPLNLLHEQMCILITTVLLIPCLALTLSNKEVPNELLKASTSDVIFNFPIPPCGVQRPKYSDIMLQKSLNFRQNCSFSKLNSKTITKQIKSCSLNILCCMGLFCGIIRKILTLGIYIIKKVSYIF